MTPSPSRRTPGKNNPGRRIQHRLFGLEPIRLPRPPKKGNQSPAGKTSMPTLVGQVIVNERRRPTHYQITKISSKYSSPAQLVKGIKMLVHSLKGKGYPEVRAPVFEDERVNTALREAGFVKRVQRTGAWGDKDQFEEWIFHFTH